MPITKLILFFTLIAYTVIVSQSFMYLIALKKVQASMQAGPYIGLRKLLDAGFRANFKYAVYAALLFNLLLVISTANFPGRLLFASSLIAFIALLADVLLTLKGNMPINDLINTWTTESYPDNWAAYRDKWLTIFQYRQVCNITGFISLLSGAVFGLK
jgi:hypothetical protein